MNVSVSMLRAFTVVTPLDITGFSGNKTTATYHVEDEKSKLTMEEMNAYVNLDQETNFATCRR